MNLSIPHELIDKQSQVKDLDNALLPILQHLDPDKEQDMGGEAGVWFSDQTFDDWPTLTDEARGYHLMKFSEFICNVYRDQ